MSNVCDVHRPRLTIRDTAFNISGHFARLAMPRLIRSATLNGYVEVARSVGLDPYRMVAAHGLPAACLANPELRIPMTAVARLLEDSAARSARPDFGLRLAERRSLSNLGVLALLVREQPTIRKALEALAGYMHLHSDGLRLTMTEDAGLVTIGLVVDSGRPLPIRQGVELGLGFIHRSLNQLLGSRWRPQAICFTHAAPGRTDAHRRFFGTNVEFGQEANAIICLARDIDIAVPTSDPAIVRHIQQYLDAVAPRPNATMRDSARECIYLTLPSGLCSADRVAKHLGVDRRTLHRHLARERETFSSLLDTVRAELATRYIGNRDRPLASVSESLGFSALSAFSRWFRNRFGCSVSQWRASQGRSDTAQRNAQD
jgi:AraC-like DNA-binding protein